MNLAYYRDRWFKTYKGLIYTNGATGIITAIYNKGIIESQQRTVKKILQISDNLK